LNEANKTFEQTVGRYYGARGAKIKQTFLVRVISCDFVDRSCPSRKTETKSKHYLFVLSELIQRPYYQLSIQEIRKQRVRFISQQVFL
jgi:hypothetical protein